MLQFLFLGRSPHGERVLKEIWEEMQAVRSVSIEVCLYTIIDYYVTYAEEKPKGYTPHTNSGTHFGY